MPQQQPTPSVENHFIAGLKTEYTGLNFPENAATDTSNCVYSLIGDVTRREGINYEANANLQQGINIFGNNVARSSFKWLNAGGDGLTQILVQQIGGYLFFYKSSAATIASPLSTTILQNQYVVINSFQAAGSIADVSQTECQYAFGNGYLFVFHPNCDPFFCTYSSGLITSSKVTLQTRDFVGIIEPGIPDNLRPSTLSNEHK